ncbi:MAG: ABC transporter ATP-binding protein, partial [Verrucomicrobia bacterium]|nr:ABC transporter ATP-binding protein [Verrucomicrobiota bacterium]
MSHTQAEVHTQEPEVLVRVEHVSKKFCRTLKRSLWYGAKDIASELNPFPQAKITSKQTQMSPPSESDLRKGEFWALQDVSFELRRGECLGLIGHNGAGKSTLLKILNGIIKPDRGRAEIRGRVGALIELG